MRFARWIAMFASSIAVAAESDVWVSANVVTPDGAIIADASVSARHSDGRVFRLERRYGEPAEARLPAGVYEFTMTPVDGWVPFRRARVTLLAGERVTLPLIAHEDTVICILTVTTGTPPPPAVKAPEIRYEEWSSDGKAAVIAYTRKWGDEYTGPAVLTFDRVTVVAGSIRVLPDRRRIEARGKVFLHRANTLTEAKEMDLDLFELAK